MSLLGSLLGGGLAWLLHSVAWAHLGLAHFSQYTENKCPLLRHFLGRGTRWYGNDKGLWQYAQRMLGRD